MLVVSTPEFSHLTEARAMHGRDPYWGAETTDMDLDSISNLLRARVIHGGGPYWAREIMGMDQAFLDSF